MTDSMAKEQYIFNLGTCVLSDGRTYVGAWKDGMKHGKGKVIRVDGRVFEGEWEKNKLNGVDLYDL